MSKNLSLSKFYDLLRSKKALDIPFPDVRMEWQLDRLYAVNKNNPAQRQEIVLDDMQKSKKSGSRKRTLAINNPSGNYVGTLTVNGDKGCSVATLTVTEYHFWDEKFKEWNTQKISQETYPNSMQILSWKADNTELQWEKGGPLFIVEKEGSGKIAFPFDKAQSRDGKFNIDMKSSDNKLLRIEVSGDYSDARLWQYDFLDFPVTDGLAIIDKPDIRQHKASNTAVALLQQQDWVADKGRLQWYPGDRLLLVDEDKTADSQYKGVEVDVTMIKPAGKSLTIAITSGNTPVFLEIAADMKNAALIRHQKPAGWNSWRWSDEQGRQEYENNARDSVTHINNVDLDWVADWGRLKWREDNHLFLIERTHANSQNRSVEINIKKAMAQEGRQKGQPAVITVFSALPGKRVVLEIAADMKSASLRRFTKPESWNGTGWHNTEGVRETAYNHTSVETLNTMVDQTASFPASAKTGITASPTHSVVSTIPGSMVIFLPAQIFTPEM